MKTPERSELRKIQLLESRLAQTEARAAEAEETLRAIREGEVDALVVAGPEGDQVFTLQGAETPYRFLVEEMNEGALLLLPDGTILYANTRFAHLAGRPLHELIGSSWETCFASADLPRLRAWLDAANQGAQRQEFELPTQNSARPVLVSLASLQREGTQGFAVVVADLTELKAAEKALRASNARLREMVDELERFSYSISHDMRAPLRAMHSFAVMLEESCANCLNKENLDLMGRISAAAGRLDALVQGSLDYARVVKEELRLQPVPLDPLLRGILDTYPNLSPDKADIQVEPNLPVVLGNEAALTQVFANLLGNAVKFVAPGTRPRVRIRAEQREGSGSLNRVTDVPEQSHAVSHHESNRFVRLWVEDNGIGIPAHVQSRIFELFQRGTQDYEGTGIGLAVVRKVLERIGGKIGLQSQPGSGTQFWVDLPTPQPRPETR